MNDGLSKIECLKSDVIDYCGKLMNLGYIISVLYYLNENHSPGVLIEAGRDLGDMVTDYAHSLGEAIKPFFNPKIGIKVADNLADYPGKIHSLGYIVNTLAFTETCGVRVKFGEHSESIGKIIIDYAQAINDAFYNISDDEIKAAIQTNEKEYPANEGIEEGLVLEI